MPDESDVRAGTIDAPREGRASIAEPRWVVKPFRAMP
jgi:hypothetical protein